MNYRFGQDDEFNVRNVEDLEPARFLFGQFHRIGIMSYPFFLSSSEVGWKALTLHSYLPVITGVLMLEVCCVGLAIARRNILLATLVVSGFCWALPLRHSVAFHDFEAVFYIGIPLAAFSYILMYVRKWTREWFISILAAASLCLFALSSSQMFGSAGLVNDNDAEDIGAAIEAEIIQDFEVIRDLVGEGSVYIPINHDDRSFAGAPFATSYFLAGAFINYRGDSYGTKPPLFVERPPELADFIVTPQRAHDAGLLTPHNRHRFLYDMETFSAEYPHPKQPIIASDYEVYLRNGSLVYIHIGESCPNPNARFFLNIVPVHKKDLPEHRKPYGTDNLDFSPDFAQSRSRCTAERKLPDYPISRITTGQYTAEGNLWDGAYIFSERASKR